MDVITSLQNERVKLARSLQERPRARRKYMLIAVEGTRLVRDAWGRGRRPEFVVNPAALSHPRAKGWLK